MQRKAQKDEAKKKVEKVKKEGQDKARQMEKETSRKGMGKGM